MSRAVRRWPAAAALLVVGFLAGGGRATLYDGGGLPRRPLPLRRRRPRAQRGAAHGGPARRPVDRLRAAFSRAGPQVQVDADAAALQCSGDAATIRADPVAPIDGPRDGALDSNVYRLSASRPAQAGPGQVLLFLRAAVMTEPDPVVVHRDRPGNTWTRLPSSRSGQDVLSARWHGLGKYAVLRLPGAHPRTRRAVRWTAARADSRRRTARGHHPHSDPPTGLILPGRRASVSVAERSPPEADRWPLRQLIPFPRRLASGSRCRTAFPPTSPAPGAVVGVSPTIRRCRCPVRQADV